MAISWRSVLSFSINLGLKQTELPVSQLFKRSIDDEETDSLKRSRRGFRSYFYNYLDEIAMSICSAIPSEGPGLIYAVRRTCGEKMTCRDICKDKSLMKQGITELLISALFC